MCWLRWSFGVFQWRCEALATSDNLPCNTRSMRGGTSVLEATSSTLAPRDKFNRETLKPSHTKAPFVPNQPLLIFVVMYVCNIQLCNIYICNSYIRSVLARDFLRASGSDSRRAVRLREPRQSLGDVPVTRL